MRLKTKRPEVEVEQVRDRLKAIRDRMPQRESRPRAAVKEARGTTREVVARARGAVTGTADRVRDAARPDEGTSKRTVAGAGVVGAATAFFLDPAAGKRRRDAVRDRIVATARSTAERLNRAGGSRKPETLAGTARPQPPTANGQAPAERVTS